MFHHHSRLHPPTAPQVGSRYTLLRVLGYGSYSAVCLAVDATTGEQVRRWAAASSLPAYVPPSLLLLRLPNCGNALSNPYPHNPHCPLPAPAQVALKRVADVLQSPEHTKRVLREICILRRLRHPSLISVRCLPAPACPPPSPPLACTRLCPLKPLAIVIAGPGCLPSSLPAGARCLDPPLLHGAMPPDQRAPRQPERRRGECRRCEARWRWLEAWLRPRASCGYASTLHSAMHSCNCCCCCCMLPCSTLRWSWPMAGTSSTCGGRCRVRVNSWLGFMGRSA